MLISFLDNVLRFVKAAINAGKEPLKVWITDEVKYLTADKEEKYVIAQANALMEKNEETRKKIEKLSEEISEIWNSEENAKQFDANGWYTGKPQDAAGPEQDADDL